MAHRSDSLPKVTLDSRSKSPISLPNSQLFPTFKGRKKSHSRLYSLQVDIPPVTRPQNSSYSKQNHSKIDRKRLELRREKTSLSVLTFPGFDYGYELQKMMGNESFEGKNEQIRYEIEPYTPNLPVLTQDGKKKSLKEPIFQLKPALIPILNVKFRHKTRSLSKTLTSNYQLKRGFSQF